MPQTIDHERMKKHLTFDVSAAPNTPTGIPTIQIPHLDFPRAVYKHPVEPFRTILHRNAKHEVVDEETVPTEHLTLLVADEAALKKALAEGYVLKPYVPQAPPDPDANLYVVGEKRHARTS